MCEIKKHRIFSQLTVITSIIEHLSIWMFAYANAAELRQLPCLSRRLNEPATVI